MTGRKVGVQGERRSVGLADNHIFVPQPVDLLEIGMSWLVRGIEPESQIDLPASSSVSAGLWGR